MQQHGLHLVLFVSARHWRASLFISLGTLVLLLHGTFGVKFIQHMTSFHCRFWPFLALLFLLDIIIDFWISLFSFSCASAKWFAWWLSVVP
ncbi:hypothetical protein MtrunA17_Chr8g0340851 [Medicago truncatula]|uniref:Transmembrane protein, putative n=1 Tax=Medicago truncatula TaxID=3880 RepID=G7LGQ7_MEDTR|nr:transmembrane protein, putative [Medicago truncatula]RHN39158.1 hypothetical protein MtrunA17_Chr8g0340851 [Medicago truncatula]